MAEYITVDTVMDNTALLKDIANSIGKLNVLVGIPEKDALRKGDPINNAALLYIHTNGSPLQHIPKRPVLEPAIEAKGNIEPITLEMEKAGKSLIDGNKAEINNHLNMAGQKASNAARKWFTDSRNGWAEDKPATIRAKLRKVAVLNSGLGKGHKGRMAARVKMKEAMETTGSTQTLIDSEQMRKAITWIKVT
jgi:hypothetical protein